MKPGLTHNQAKKLFHKLVLEKLSISGNIGIDFESIAIALASSKEGHEILLSSHSIGTLLEDCLATGDLIEIEFSLLHKVGVEKVHLYSFVEANDFLQDCEIELSVKGLIYHEQTE